MLDETLDAMIVSRFRMANRGVFAGSVVRILESGPGDILVTTDLLCDPAKPIRPKDVQWCKATDLRPLTDMEVIGAMAQ